jgi:hypothetical protein
MYFLLCFLFYLFIYLLGFVGFSLLVSLVDLVVETCVFGVRSSSSAALVRILSMLLLLQLPLNGCYFQA